MLLSRGAVSMMEIDTDLMGDVDELHLAVRDRRRKHESDEEDRVARSDLHRRSEDTHVLV